MIKIPQLEGSGRFSRFCEGRWGRGGGGGGGGVLVSFDQINFNNFALI